MKTIITNSSEIKKSPTLIPARSGIFTMSQGLPLRDANAVREFAYVFIRIPYQATAYEPPIPKIE